MSRERARLIREITQRIGSTTERATQMSHAAAGILGINSTDMMCIRMLQDGPLPAGELARRTGLSTAAITTVIDRLEQAGFVARTRDAADRRRVVVQFQAEDAGPGVSAVFRPVLGGWRDAMAGYDDRDLRLIADFLSRIEGVISTGIQHLQDAKETRPRTAARDDQDAQAGLISQDASALRMNRTLRGLSPTRRIAYGNQAVPNGT
jgi:DNA-binding MarR family transcriptional regulator